MAPIDNINRPSTSSPTQPNSPVGGGPDDLEELVGSLDDETNQPDPLSQMGYQPESTADRQHEIDEDEKKAERLRFIQEQLRKKEGERAGGIADKIKSAKNSFSKRFGGAPKPVATNSSGQLGAKAAAKTEAKAAASQAVKQAGRQVGKVIVKGIFTNPYVLGALAIVAVIFIIIMVIFSLNAGGGNSGAGPASYPSTETQRDQTTMLSALSGNQIAKDTLVKKFVDSEKGRYQQLKENAQKYTPNVNASIDQKIKEFTPLWDSLVSTRNLEERKKIFSELNTKRSEFEGTLPFGTWIVKIAHEYVGDATACFITPRWAKYACAAFTSTVLLSAGVPLSGKQTLTTDLWNEKALRLVIDRSTSSKSNTALKQLDKLQPGDIVWFGYKRRDGTGLFVHVGIYIGNQQIIDSSSSQLHIVKRPITTHKGFWDFNGAKRYGATSR